jgi:hypothetical protein
VLRVGKVGTSRENLRGSCTGHGAHRLQGHPLTGETNDALRDYGRRTPVPNEPLFETFILCIQRKLNRDSLFVATKKSGGTLEPRREWMRGRGDAAPAPDAHALGLRGVSSAW